MFGNSKIFRLALLALSVLLAGNLSAQTVKGTVKDSGGEPVIGATVQEQGTKNVAVTDLDGNFTIKLTGDNPLQISYIGMKTTTVSTKGKTTVAVTLEDEATALDDLVVIGYGSVRKRDLTGAVTSVNAEQIGNTPVANVSEALTGKMAGVNITTTEGSPDADVKIRVRGGGSLSQDNSPCTSSTDSQLRVSATFRRRKSRVSTCLKTHHQPQYTAHAEPTASLSSRQRAATKASHK